MCHKSLIPLEYVDTVLSGAHCRYSYVEILSSTFVATIQQAVAMQPSLFQK